MYAIIALISMVLPMEAAFSAESITEPLSAVIYEYCGRIQLVIVTFDDGKIEVYNHEDLKGRAWVLATVVSMENKYYVRLPNIQTCTCSM